MSIETFLADICPFLDLKSSSCHSGTMCLVSCSLVRLDGGSYHRLTSCPLDGADTCLAMLSIAIGNTACLPNMGSTCIVLVVLRFDVTVFA